MREGQGEEKQKGEIRKRGKKGGKRTIMHIPILTAHIVYVWQS